MILLNLALCLWIIPNRSTTQSLLDSADDSQSFGVPTLLLDSLQLTLSSKLLLDVYSPRAHTLKGYLGWLPMKSNMTYSSCTGDDSPSESICLRYGNDMKLLVTQDSSDHCETESMTCHAVECHKVQWINHIGGAMDCFLLGEDNWYGGGEMIYQTWPLNGDSRPWFPAVTGDPLHHASGNVVENLWISSSGFIIYVDNNVPLFVSFNESGSGKLCFTTSSKKHPYEIEVMYKQELSYSICSATSVKEAYSFSSHKWIKKPSSIPEEMVFHYPIWSTWARYKRQIDENVVLKFAQEIKLADFPASQLEIDDKWEDCYGSLDFNFTRFPDPKGMVDELHEMGFPTTLWVHPFCNRECESFEEGERNGFWVKNKDGNTSRVKWWNGDSDALLDTTNKNAVEWFVERLRTLKSKYGVDSFKFDAGEVLWLDSNFVLRDPAANLQPNLYSKSYAELAARFGGRVEVRVGYNSQDLPIFIRMFDKFSRWDYANGLRTLIPNALQLSFMGYYFILPDMIGGNNYDSFDSLPDRELYIRWIEATVFLPVVQFSIVPWDYDDEVVAISKKMVELHDKYSSNILHFAERATVTAEPIIRPLWWISPDDIDSLRTDSQFLVGDVILVAPVVVKGKRRRDIYLPDGKWTDVQRGKTHEGPQWLYDYDAPLDFLPFFIRQS